MLVSQRGGLLRVYSCSYVVANRYRIKRYKEKRAPKEALSTKVPNRAGSCSHVNILYAYIPTLATFYFVERELNYRGSPTRDRYRSYPRSRRSLNRYLDRYNPRLLINCRYN